VAGRGGGRHRLRSSLATARRGGDSGSWSARRGSEVHEGGAWSGSSTVAGGGAHVRERAERGN
jgi:hypothetical protein